MRSNVALRLVVMCSVAFPGAAESSTMVLDGDVSVRYSNGDFLVYYGYKPPAADGRKPESLEAAFDVAGRAPIGPDGKFRLEVDVDRPRPVYFIVVDAFNAEGMRLGSTSIGNGFILEPGNLELKMGPRHLFVVKGGKYNDLVYNTWRLSDDYRVAVAEYDRLVEPVEDETEEAGRRRMDRLVEADKELLKLEMEGRSRIAHTHTDLLVRRLTIQSAQHIGPWVLEALRGLAELAPDDPWVVERLARAESDAKTWAEHAKRFAVGAEVLDFVGETLAGEAVRLADVRAASRYVLVEFWASWCGPCLVEIPHMKEAYSRYKDKGFEIVSFTIDEDREAWEEASAKAELPWHDLGMGPDAEAPTVYEVAGVPKNYLVDARSGEIVAKDLRQHHLDEKLEELLD